MRSVARSKGELGAVGRVGLVAAMFAVVVGCASQPVAPLRGPLPRGAVRLVSHLESPLRIRTLGVAVDGGLSVFHYNDSSAPLPAYIILPRPHVPGVHFLQVHVEVAHPCFPAGDLQPTESIRRGVLFTDAAPPTRIEFFHGPGARSTGTGIHVRVVGALRPADLPYHHPPAPELPASIASEGCVRDVLRMFDERLNLARAHCDGPHGGVLNERDGFQQLLVELPNDATRARRIAELCRWFGRNLARGGSYGQAARECSRGHEVRQDLRGCDAYPDHDTPLRRVSEPNPGL